MKKKTVAMALTLICVLVLAASLMYLTHAGPKTSSAEPQNVATSSASETYRYEYTPPAEVTSARVYIAPEAKIFLTGTDGWALFPANDKFDHAFIFGPADDRFILKTSRKPTKIVWRLTDGSEQPQEITQ